MKRIQSMKATPVLYKLD